MQEADQITPATGRCLCGSVRFKVNGPLRNIQICHCVLCRRMNTHVGAYTACQISHLEIEPTDALRWYSATDRARRGFCMVCGSALFWEPSSRNYIAISVGSLEGQTGLSVVRHVCVDQKGDYYEINETATS
jgi:hypothetical protein